MARSLSAGRITRLVSWRSSLRAFDSSGLRLGAEGFALLRTPMIWVRALSMTSVHPKDPTPLQDKAGVVYKIPCSSCPRVYIGQTGRTLGQRVKEHQRSVRDKKIATSALAEHLERTGHTIDWTSTEVLDNCTHTSKRCLVESWMIQKEPSSLNRELGTLPTVYKTLM